MKLKTIIPVSVLLLIILSFISLFVAKNNSITTGILWGVTIAVLPIPILSATLEKLKRRMNESTALRKVAFYIGGALLRLGIPLLICVSGIFYFHINSMGLIIGVTSGMFCSAVLAVLIIKRGVMPVRR